ncbi:hypothetical protein BKA67DRAFT_693119 [Truncatella angustata]|uniref:Fe2OG dioxygenase domain-containing protein n=1 Tax=Truncatella angustata TaxID=152316 RepID=A0A9P8ZW96_9PEZI|nr:uncharacterized protein BKA67DRAFT_693119 [Truncatella angustata]KAH6651887.1 hypothetical protein BKA67DRAFT_693119 [Truncatella angustata]KAH8205618.1 hypothetical protein TruAng_000112 [Truncatella angustata]
MNSLGKRKNSEASDEDRVLGDEAKRLRELSQPAQHTTRLTTMKQSEQDGVDIVTQSSDTSEFADTPMSDFTPLKYDIMSADSPMSDFNPLKYDIMKDFVRGTTKLNDPSAASSSIGEDVTRLNTLKLLRLIQASPIWAHTRSALCDSLPYFRSHQGGNYHIDNVTHGILVDGCGSDRDHNDGTVIITTVGGEKTGISSSGQRLLQADQSERTANYKGLKKSKEQCVSVVVVSGNQNKFFQLPFPYCVLDEYQITDIWMEKFPEANDGFAGWMVRFERLDFDKPAWFLEDKSHSYVADQYHCPEEECQGCCQSSKRIYTIGWTCLNAQCPIFFLFPVDIDGETHWQQKSSSSLVYSDAFLKERTDYRKKGTVHQRRTLMPDLPTAGDNVGTELPYGRGIVCPKCHCCSRRIYWGDWRCENESCDFTYKLDFPTYPLTEIQRETEAAMKKFNTNDQFLVSNWNTVLAGHEANFYALPNEDGKVCGIVVVLRATKEICDLPNGPNELFIGMQTQDLELMRRGSYQTGRKREQLTNHFASNWGAEYEFGVHVDTKGFSDAPKEILTVASQLSWAQAQVMKLVKKKFLESKIDYLKQSMSLESEDFNEVLSLAYFANSAIGYHDDGEKQLGPTVASISLGSPSMMRFKPKLKNSSIGIKGTEKSTNKKAVVSFRLFHGDICIMHGVDIHKYYLHQVTPEGKLRFALTSRYIRPDMMRDDIARHNLTTMSKHPYDIKPLAYKGIGAEPMDDNETTIQEGSASITQPGAVEDLDTNDKLIVRLRQPYPELYILMQSLSISGGTIPSDDYLRCRARLMPELRDMIKVRRDKC